MKIREANHNAIPFRFPLRVESVAEAGVLLSALLVISYCVWMLDRGFEITDEAYYLLLAMHSDSVKYFISAQQWLMAGIWQVTGSITMFRAAGMILLLASAAVFSHGVLSVCQRLDLVGDRFVPKAVVLAGSAVSALLYASTINLSPSYNLLASVGAYAAAGLVLLASSHSNIMRKYALFALAGCAVGAAALCKLSAGVAILALLAFWVCIFERSRFDKIFGSVVMAFGAVTFAGITLLANTSIGDATQAFEQGMQLFRMVQVETIWERLVRYRIDFWQHFLIALGAFGIPVVAMIVYMVTRRINIAVLGIGALVITLMFGSLDAGEPVFLIQNAISDSYLFGGFSRYVIQIIAIFAMLIMALIVSNSVWNKSWETRALFAGMLLLPYSVAIGTGNALFTQIIGSLGFWGALIAVLMVARYPVEFDKIPILLIGICFMVTIALQVVTSSLRPYHLLQPLTKQDQAIKVGNLGEVKVDAETDKFLSDMKMAIKECDIAPGAPFIGLYNIPGVALVLQAVPVLTPWLNNSAQAEFVMERVHPGGLRSAVVALQMESSGALPPLPQQLAGFPLGYRYCGTTTYPYNQQKIQIWQSP